MLKSFLSTILFMFCFLIFETALVSNLTFLPAFPDFLLMITLYISLNNGPMLGQTTGFASGVMLDFMSAAPLGFNGLLRTILGFIVGLFHNIFNSTSVLLQFLYGAVGTILKALLVLLISFFFKGIIVYSLFSKLFLTELLLNTLLTPVMFKFLSLFSDHLTVKPETIL